MGMTNAQNVSGGGSIYYDNTGTFRINNVFKITTGFRPRFINMYCIDRPAYYVYDASISTTNFKLNGIDHAIGDSSALIKSIDDDGFTMDFNNYTIPYGNGTMTFSVIG